MSCEPLIANNRRIRRAFAQAVQDHEQCAFYIDSFHRFLHWFETCASEANPNNMSEQFVQNNTMETISNNILNSSCCVLFEKCPREAACRGASGGGHSVECSCLGLLDLKSCSELCFEGNTKWNPKRHQQSKTSCKNDT